MSNELERELDRFGIVPVNFRDPEENITVAGITLANARALVAEIVRLTPEPRAPWWPCDNTWDCEGTWHFSECPKLPKREHAGQPPVVFR
jgi:hypothetical protein